MESDNIDLVILNGVYVLTSQLDIKKPITIFYHGNACSVRQSESLVQTLTNNYIIPEYPGYSGTEIYSMGITKGIINGVRDLSEWIIKTKLTVHIIGQSIGTGPACLLAELIPRRQLRSLQLITPFTTLSELINYYTYFCGYLVSDYYYDNINRLMKLSAYCPINIFHGTKDNVIPVTHSMKIKDKIGECGNVQVYIIEGLNHNDIWTQEVCDKVKQFMD